MPQYSMPEPPTAPHLRPVAEPPRQRLSSPTESTAPAPAAPDLTINKVIAGAGAAATSAVLGSFFGAAGTVTGAALGSVASTIASVIYQRSLDRTRDRLVARVRVTPGRRPDVASPSAVEFKMPAQRTAPDAETVRLRVEPAIQPPRRRRAWLWVGATVLVFAIGLLAVTGVEWAKGSSITTGESGTSVGRVIDGNRGATAPTQAPEATATPESSSSSEPTTAPTQEPTPSNSPESGTAPTPAQTPAPTPAPTRAPGDRPGLGGGDGSQGGESAARPTPPAPLPLDPGE
jgi:hypothetical protein